MSPRRQHDARKGREIRQMRLTHRQILQRALIALLLSHGVMLPLVRVLGLWQYGLLGSAVLVVTLAGLSLVSRRRITCVAAAVAVLGGAAIWIGISGARPVREAVCALALAASGLPSALPLYALEATALLSALIALAAWLASASGVCSAVLALLTLGMLWLSGHEREMGWAFPAVVGACVMLALNAHEHQPPLRHIFPWAAAVALLAFLLTPHGGVTVEPLREAADALRQRVNDYLFFTQPRNVFSLASEGYYPQGTSQLGGAATPDGSAVMTVQTPQRVYLRGTVKDTYTGRVWLDTIGGQRYLWPSPLHRSAREHIFDMSLPPDLMAQSSVLRAGQVTVTMLDDSASTLFMPQRVRSLSTGGDLVPYFNSSSEVFVTRDLAQGDTYTVHALLATGGDAGLETLVNACADGADEEQYRRVAAAYTALPGHIQQEVYQLAMDAAAGADTPYARAMSVQRWLTSYCRYTLEVDPQPENVDFVGNFLLRTREGYCTYFASAMTVLCRMLGLPARYVEGYLAQPNEDGVALITGLQAHAWTEVYFAGFGWVTFDATPVSHDMDSPPDSDLPPQQSSQGDLPTATPAPGATPPQDQPTPTPIPTEQATEQPTASHQPRTTNALPTHAQTPQPPQDDGENAEMPPLARRGGWMWWLLVLVLLALAGWRIRFSRPEALEKRAKDDLCRWDIWAQALHDQLDVMKLPRMAAESPMAYFSRLASSSDLPDDLAGMGVIEAMLFYGRYVPEQSDVTMVRDLQRTLWQRMTKPQRVRWLLVRAFTPLKKRQYTRFLRGDAA